MDGTCLFMAVKVDSKKTSYTIFNVKIETAVVHIDKANDGLLVEQAWVMITLGVTYLLKGIFQMKEEVLRTLLESIEGLIKL